MIYLLYEREKGGEYHAKRRADGGLYLFYDSVVADQIARAFCRGGLDVVALSFDLDSEVPNLS